MKKRHHCYSVFFRKNHLFITNNLKSDGNLTETTFKELTQLENELYSKIKTIEKFLIQTKYTPKRVEPSIDMEINDQNRWSKYSGETLFINQSFLQDNVYQSSIFWREAFLLFAPKTCRDLWWIKFLANAFPLSIRMSQIKSNKWEKLWRKVTPGKSDLINNCKQLIASAGSEGIIDVLKHGLYETYYKHEEKLKLGQKSRKISDLSSKEFELLLSEIYLNSVSISENAVDILEKILINQTIKPTIIKKHTNSHKSTISKTIKRLLDMQIIVHAYDVNYFALGLTQYIVLLICLKDQSFKFKSLPKNPFLFSHKFNCLNACVITQYYVAPRTKTFYDNLVSYCERLMAENLITKYYAFEITKSSNNYTFRYFNPKTKMQKINFNDIAIESDLFEIDKIESKTLEKGSLKNIIVPSRIVDIEPQEIDLIDLKILNQYLVGNNTRRVIQKNIKKDMNETVQRIRKLLASGILYEGIWVILPNTVDINLYIENDITTRKNKNTRSLKERLTRFCNFLPNVYLGEIEGHFNGLMIRAYLPHSAALSMADFFTWFLPENVNNQIILGKSTHQKYARQFVLNRWDDGSWIFYKEDFDI